MCGAYGLPELPRPGLPGSLPSSQARWFWLGLGATAQQPPAAAAAGMINCSRCGTPSQPGAAFCGKCGNKFETAQPQVKFCTKCGSENSAEAAFCAQCGQKLS